MAKHQVCHFQNQESPRWPLLFSTAIKLEVPLKEKGHRCKNLGNAFLYSSMWIKFLDTKNLSVSCELNAKQTDLKTVVPKPANRKKQGQKKQAGFLSQKNQGLLEKLLNLSSSCIVSADL